MAKVKVVNSRPVAPGSFEISIRPSDPVLGGRGRVAFRDGTQRPWASDPANPQADVWVAVGAHRVMRVFEDGDGHDDYSIPGVEM